MAFLGPGHDCFLPIHQLSHHLKLDSLNTEHARITSEKTEIFIRLVYPYIDVFVVQHGTV